MRKIIFLFFCPFAILSAQNYTLENSDECADCHEAIHRQWQNSMHYKSTLERDVLYRAMFDWAMEDTQGKIAARCKSCHQPYADLQSDSLIRTTDLNRPVDCVYCHSISDIHQPPVFSKTKYSAESDTTSDAHRIEKREHFKNEQLCMMCHAELLSPSGIPVCITGDEFYIQNSDPDKKSCQECHMPLEPADSAAGIQIRSHSFLGPHNPEFLNKSLKLDGKMAGQDLFITIANENAPHAYPTGSPLRLVILKVLGFDGDKKIIFQNWQGNPITEDPKAVFARTFGDERGNSPVPPWKAASVRLDSRLSPGEIRKIRYKMPAGTKSIAVKLFFQLAPVPILNRLKIDDPYLRTSHLIDEFQLDLDK